MNNEELRLLVDCAADVIWKNTVIFAGCQDSTELLRRVLEKAGVKSKRRQGFVNTIKEESIAHCWLETEDTIIESNPSQVWGLPKGALAMEKGLWGKITKPREDSTMLTTGLTPEGERFYNAMTEEVLNCFRSKTT